MRSALALVLQCTSALAASSGPGGLIFCCGPANSSMVAGPKCTDSTVSEMSVAFENLADKANITYSGAQDKKGVKSCTGEATKVDGGKVNFPNVAKHSDCLDTILAGEKASPSNLTVIFDSAKKTLTVAVAQGGPTVTLGVCKSNAPADTSGAKSPMEGYAGIAVAAVCFGSNFAVVKNKEWDPKDGLFFQFNMVIGVFFTGMLYHYAVRGAPPLQPMAMLGGAGWAIGNAACPFIIETVGMGVGLSIWGSINLLTGWSSGHFGILGVAREGVRNDPLNVVGAAFAVCAILFYAQVKPKPTPPSSANEREPLLPKSGSLNSGEPTEAPRPKKNKMLGVIAAVCAGFLFGVCFNPAAYVIHQAEINHCNPLSNSKDTCLSYVGGTQHNIYCTWDGTAEPAKMCGGMPDPDLAFSQFCGIFFASLGILFVYGIYSQFYLGSNMYVNIPLIIPGIVSGIIWAFAQIGWFVANKNLPFVVTFPIINVLPAIVANTWGFFVFSEVATDTPNVSKLLIGIGFSVAAAATIAAST